jgi:hypothetical protein
MGAVGIQLRIPKVCDAASDSLAIQPVTRQDDSLTCHWRQYNIQVLAWPPNCSPYHNCLKIYNLNVDRLKGDCLICDSLNDINLAFSNQDGADVVETGWGGGGLPAADKRPPSHGGHSQDEAAPALALCQK